MKLTPLDVKSQTFSTRWKGFDPLEVQSFLEAVTNDLEELASENNTLKDEAKRLRSDLEEHTQREKTLKETMVTAQRLADEIRQNAQERGKLLISESEVKAEKILDAAHRRAAKISEDISELKRQRMSLESAIRATIQSHLSMLDGLREENKDQDELDEKLKFLLRKNG
jgi:cell division initiation protein